MKNLLITLTGPVLLLLLLLVVVPSPLCADVIKANSLRGSSDGVNIVILWETADESSVARFEIERRSDADPGFQFLAALDAKGTPSSYDYLDNTAFRKTVTVYRYRIKIVYADGRQPTYTTEIPVFHTVSGVRRTWGSIKSMFRFP